MVTRPNILIVSAAPLRPDRLSCYGYGHATLPALDRLAEEGTLFLNAWSTSSWTPSAHASLLTGLYPTSHGVVLDEALDERVPTLASLLAEAGYRTVGFVADSNIGQYRRLGRGFAEYHELWQRYVGRLGTGSGRARSLIKGFWKLGRAARRLGLVTKLHDAPVVTRSALDWLAAHGQDARPFLMLLHYKQTHHPYDPPARFRPHEALAAPGVDRRRLRRVNIDPTLAGSGGLTLSPAELAALGALYDGEIRFLDEQLGLVLDHLRSSGSIERTVVVFLAQHGESLGEHGLTHNPFFLDECLLRIPLILRWPARIPAGLRQPGFVQLVDVLPTLLELAGCRHDALALHGRSLLPIDAGRRYREVMLAEGPTRRALRRGRWKYLSPDELGRLEQEDPECAREFLERLRAWVAVFEHRWDVRQSDGGERLVDLAADPAERSNLAAAEPERTRAMAAELARLVERLEQRQDAPEADAPDPSLLEDLRASGYRI